MKYVFPEFVVALIKFIDCGGNKQIFIDLFV